MKFSLSFTTILSSVLLATNVNAMWHPSSSSNLTWDYLLSGSDSTMWVVKNNNNNKQKKKKKKKKILIKYLNFKL